jgi:hypothetical protein
MVINSKFENITLTAIFIMYFLLLKQYFSSSFYLIIVVVASIYFFPIKIILNRETEKLSLLIVSSFLISSVLILSYLSFILVQLPQFLKLTLFFYTLLNSYLIYKFVQINSDSKYLHLIIMLIIITAFFK